MIRNLVLIIRDSTEWLYTILYQNNFFFIDYWSFLHFINGLLIVVLLTNFTIKNIITKLFIILFLYEFIEISMFFISLDIFKPEIIKDQITDIFIGLIGGIMWLTIVKFRKYSFGSQAAKLVTAFIISFLWVGFYNYRYNIGFFNTEGLNVWSFALWFISGNLILVLYDFLNKYFQNYLKTLLLLYSVYLISLFSFEYIGQEILMIHEISKQNSKPLIFNLIHGNIYLHIFYLTAPFILILSYSILNYLFEKSFQNIYNHKCFQLNFKKFNLFQI